MNILELSLLTNDLEGTKSFYNGLLGVPVNLATSSCLSFSVNQSMLTFNQTEVHNPVYHFAFNIPSDKIIEALTWVRSRTEVIEISDNNYIAEFEQWNARSFYFYDNNSNIVEFIARHELNVFSELPFDVSSVLSISEIGIVVDDVGSYCSKITNEHELPFFTKQESSDLFTALGDDHGLMLIVRKERNWFPTNIKAASFGLMATIVNEGMLLEIKI